jgi:hypothetical protein
MMMHELRTSRRPEADAGAAFRRAADIVKLDFDAPKTVA